MFLLSKKYLSYLQLTEKNGVGICLLCGAIIKDYLIKSFSFRLLIYISLILYKVDVWLRSNFYLRKPSSPSLLCKNLRLKLIVDRRGLAKKMNGYVLTKLLVILYTCVLGQQSGPWILVSLVLWLGHPPWERKAKGSKPVRNSFWCGRLMSRAPTCLVPGTKKNRSIIQEELTFFLTGVTYSNLYLLLISLCYFPTYDSIAYFYEADERFERFERFTFTPESTLHRLLS